MLLRGTQLLEDGACLDLSEKRCRVRSRTAATFKKELLVIIINGLQPLTLITKCSILDVTAVLDPPVGLGFYVKSGTY